jgi:tRNA pseudouridine55 synthase
VQRAPRRISVSSIDVIDGADDVWRIDVRCSKGTYIRVLAEDIGRLLGCGAHLQALRRIGSGSQSIDSAITLDALAALDEAGRDARLQDCDALLAEAPLLRLDATAALRFLAGMRQPLDRPDAPLVRVYGPQTHAFLGSAQIRAHELIGNRLLSPAEAQGLLTQTNESVSP